MKTARRPATENIWPATILFALVYLATLAVVLSPTSLRVVAAGDAATGRTAPIQAEALP